MSGQAATKAETKAETDKAQGVDDLGIPPCPRIIIDFMEEMRRDDPDFRKLAGLVQSDAALAAAALKTANSPAYGLRAKATTVQQACTYLGLRSTALLISGLLLRRAFPVEKSAAMDELWRRAARTANGAAALAPKFSGVERDTAYTYALFRDCGQAVLLRKHPDYGGFIDGSARAAGVTTTAAETARYGIDHALIGAKLARSWELGDMMCDAIGHHHAYAEIAAGTVRPPVGSLRLIALCALAEHLSTPVGGTPPAWSEWAFARPLVETVLGVSEKSLGAFVDLLAETPEPAPA